MSNPEYEGLRMPHGTEQPQLNIDPSELNGANDMEQRNSARTYSNIPAVSTHAEGEELDYEYEVTAVTSTRPHM